MNILGRLNCIAHDLCAKNVISGFGKKLRKMQKSRPDLFRPVDADIEAKYLNLWGKLGLPVNINYLRLFCNISGIYDYRYMPEDLFLARIERVLNDCNRSGFEAEDKNLYSLYVPREYQPRFVLRYCRGCFFDEAYNYVSENKVSEILRTDVGDLIGKCSEEFFVDGGCATAGGHGIKGYFYKKDAGYFDKTGNQLSSKWIKDNYAGYVIQERVKQCEFSGQFNQHSANTCRIITFRRPWDGRVVVVKAGMRFGVTRDVFDNLSSGGVGVAMDKHGMLSPIAFSWITLNPHLKHPTSGVLFENMKHPYFDKMVEVACNIAAKVPNYNMISWDFIATEDGSLKILEMNTTRQGSDWEQYNFGPLFGEMTEDVVSWCVANKKLDQFRHLRRWY